MRLVNPDEIMERYNWYVDVLENEPDSALAKALNEATDYNDPPTIRATRETAKQGAEIATCKCGERPIFNRFPRLEEYYTLRLCCPKCGATTRSRQCCAIAGDIAERNFMIAEWNQMQKGQGDTNG